MKNKWFIIKSGAKTGFYNMAADEHMLSFDAPVLRIYSFKPFCMSLGYFMDAGQGLNYDFLNKQRVDVTRRSTGGKAVLHSHELTFSVSAPLKLFGESVIKGYDRISDALLIALKQIGVDAAKSSGTPAADGAICFASKSKYEIVSGSKKICGAAQKKFGKRLLHHASVPLNIDYEFYSSCFSDKEYGHPDKLREVMSSLSLEAGKDIDYDCFKEALISGFIEAFDIEFEEYFFSEEEELLINKKETLKYAMPCWIADKTR